MGNDLSGTLDWLVPVAEDDNDDDVIVIDDDVIGSDDPVVVDVDSDVCIVESEGVSVSMLDGELSVSEVVEV